MRQLLYSPGRQASNLKGHSTHYLESKALLVDERNARGFVRRAVPGLLTGALFTMLCGPIHAQSTASIEGQVNDQQGAIVRAVEITAVSREIGLRRVAVSDDEGRYQIAALPVGSYRIEVRAPGFQTQIIESSTLEVGRRVTHNFQLQVGDVSQVVIVRDRS